MRHWLQRRLRALHREALIFSAPAGHLRRANSLLCAQGKPSGWSRSGEGHLLTASGGHTELGLRVWDRATSSVTQPRLRAQTPNLLHGQGVRSSVRGLGRC